MLSGLEHLAPPAPDELRALQRAGITSPDIRLACQIRPRNDLSVVTLVQPSSARPDRRNDRYAAGIELSVTVMFIDIRGFTRFSEGRLPYDVVFILNQYLGRMSDVIVANGGAIWTSLWVTASWRCSAWMAAPMTAHVLPCARPVSYAKP